MKYLTVYRGYRMTLRDTLQEAALIADRYERKSEYAGWVASPVWDSFPIRPAKLRKHLELPLLEYSIAYLTDLDPRQGRAWKWARAVAYWLSESVPAKAIATKLKEEGIENSARLAAADKPIYQREKSGAKANKIRVRKTDGSVVVDDQDWGDEDELSMKELIVDYEPHLQTKVKSFKRGATALLQVRAGPPANPPRFTLARFRNGSMSDNATVTKLRVGHSVRLAGISPTGT